MVKSPKSTDTTFMILGFNDRGRVEAAASYISPPDEALARGKLRASQAGFHQFHVYQVRQDGNGNLLFERVR